MSKLGTRVLMAIPTTSAAPRSPAWIDAMASLHMPLGSTLGRLWMANEGVAAARNALCQKALELDVDYLFFLADDVLAPGNALIAMLDRIDRDCPLPDGRVGRVDMITGVYWTKTYPSEPYLWQGLLKGTYRDWTVGEFFPIDFAGCDCLMIPTRVLRAIEPPWFSTEWTWEEGQAVSPTATEDFYFFSKARAAGFRLWADTGIQCLHEDRATLQLYGLTTDMPQAGGAPEGGPGALTVAELGAGTDSPAWGADCTVTRFDARADVRPDVRCDIRAIPEHYFGRYDVVHARHVLEHFSRVEAPALVRHWSRLLKVGGQLVIRVPNVAAAMRRILAADEGGPPSDRYDWAQIYGGQSYDLDFHKNGFTARKLKALLSLHPCLADVEVVEEQGGLNLKGTARLARADVPPALSTMWEAIAEHERPAPLPPEIDPEELAVVSGPLPHELGPDAVATVIADWLRGTDT